VAFFPFCEAAPPSTLAKTQAAQGKIISV